jgi:hypothetical protein
MRSIFEYQDYQKLLKDASRGIIAGVFPDTLEDYARQIRRASVEGPTTAILFFRDLAKAMNLHGDSANHLRNLMLPTGR